MFITRILSSFKLLLATVLLINVGLSQAMLPPPMLRAVCSAFADAEEAAGNTMVAAGKAAVDMAMKPIAVVGGLKAAAVGTGMKVVGGATKFVGAKLAKDGALLEATGAGVKGAGLGVAALGVKPLAEKVVAAGNAAQGPIDAAKQAAQDMANKVGDTSLQIGATLDSPLVGHHHKEISLTAGLDTALHNQALNSHTNALEQTVEQAEQHHVAKRAAKIDVDVMKSALNLVKEARMEDCVARAICDLNCNPQGFGQDGKQVFMNMVRLQGANVLEQSETKYFHEAASKGRASSGNCDQCATHYSECKSKSSDLIKMASHIRMD